MTIFGPSHRVGSRVRSTPVRKSQITCTPAGGDQWVGQIDAQHTATFPPPNTLPDGVFYQSLVRNEQKIEITGIAESNNRVSSLMRQLDKSDWFQNPNLTSVQAATEFGEQASAFKMAVEISPPQEKTGDK